VVAGTIALGVVGDQGVPAIAIGIAVPVAQLYASIRGEQATMRRRGGRE
jgi:DNA-binding IclR family transcriptional regulator